MVWIQVWQKYPASIEPAFHWISLEHFGELYQSGDEVWVTTRSESAMLLAQNAVVDDVINALVWCESQGVGSYTCEQFATAIKLSKGEI
jgi:hypothetical protein